MTTDKKTPYNSTYPKGGVSCSKDSFVFNGSLVFQIKFCGKNPALRVAAKRYKQLYYDTMRQLTTIIALTFGLISCTDQTNNPVENKPLSEAQQIDKLDKLNIDFNEPIQIDSSVYVMYPLSFNNNEEESKVLGSSSYGSPATYWNIIFYNTANGEYHLLDDKRKMVIYSYDPRNSNVGSSSSSSEFGEFIESGFNQVDKLLYYSVTILDFNKDGKLNAQDPNYLFISDKLGKNFKQVSPENFNVTNWQTIKGTNKILIQATKDTNNDKKFNDKDETIPMVYDLNINGISKDIFKDDFKIKLKKQLDDQWTQKD